MDQGMPRARWTRPFVRVALAISVAGLLLMSTAGNAAAHSALEASDPPAGAVLATQPAVVTLTFNEAVEVDDGAIEVFDDRFNRVDAGHVTSIGPSRIQVGLRSGLTQGTYTVSWHASSADTHAVSGSFRFSVGHQSVVRGTVPGGDTNDLAGAMLGALRWTGYLGLVLGPGVLLVAVALWPAALTERRTRRLTLAGLSLLAVSTLGTMLLQGVWASGQPISALWTAPATLDTHSRRFDQIYAVRSFLLLGFAVALVLALSRSVRVPTRSRRLLLGATTVSSVALLATWPVVGHSAVGNGSALAIAVNLVHTFAMTVWLGGLVLVLVSLSAAERATDMAAVLPRFSRLALAAVATLVATGTFMAWREVGSVNALTATTFGRVLLVKLTGVAVLVVLGNLARLWVKRHLSGGMRGSAAHGSQPGVELLVPGRGASLRRGLIAEATIAFGVLAATAALVVIAPPR
jgi:copper transport protein